MTPRFIIRDGVETDLDPCLALDHTYETEHVWQTSLRAGSDSWHISFSTERLPRPIETRYDMSASRLQAALDPAECFIVAVDEADPTHLLGYLTMQADPTQTIMTIEDVVVTRSFRRQQIGSRLLGVARLWAQERHARHLFIRTQTRNYPSILFCQYHGFTFCGFNDQLLANHDIAIFFGQPLT